MSVPATTINKVCLSGLNSIYLADLLIAAGEADVVVAGGMESMTKAPYLLPGARAGYRAGDGTLVDSMMYDGLYCQFDHCAMGLEHRAVQPGGRRSPGTPRTAFAALSHERAATAIKDGRFADEIVPVSVPQRKGDPIVVDTDEGVRPGTTAESLGALKPAFDKDGTITAGNASQISDGGAAVVVDVPGPGRGPGRDAPGRGRELRAGGRARRLAPAAAGQRHRCRPWPRWASRPPTSSLFEINEAFAVVGLASMAELGITDEVTNVNGGAIALGHPIGMSGTRLALTMLHELRRRGRRSRRRQPVRWRRPGRRPACVRIRCA